ncbi:hypothetical protein [Gayadomonas joobiniege]|uniref:hypothetical protein n=1 Tax=Gayadomonas joobiniege TaxID=1234606 RepID=UPI00037D80DA|nr:hypothetical protein [Gayadomonas joobiniege]
MKANMKSLQSVLLVSVAMTTFASCTDQEQIGASLHEKVELTLEEIPAQAKEVIKQARPGFTPKEAEKEFKHGNTYIDIEGLDKNGNEIEFDMMLRDGQWEIVEIQRDLRIQETPQKVVEALQAKYPNIKAKRIIESEQTTGEVIYEFYTRDDSGNEAKYEVKLENGNAEFLEQEWQH